MSTPAADRDRPSLDNIDLDIVAALHVAPRVPSAALADILGVPSSTVSRRLSRMQDERMLRVVGRFAWELITSSNPFELWITSAPGRSREVLDELLRIPDIQFATQVSGPSDIHVHLYPLIGSDAEQLLAERVPSIAGLIALDSRMMLQPAKVGQSWRFARLDDAVVRALEAHRPDVSVDPISSLDELSDLEFATMRILGANARETAATIARQLDVSPSTAARAIKTVVHSGAVTPRVEIQPSLIGYPLNALLSLDVSPKSIGPVLEALADQPNVRLLNAVTGAEPISLSAAFSGPAALAEFIRTDLGDMKGVRAVSSSVVLRLARRYWIDRERWRLGTQVPNVLRRA